MAFCAHVPFDVYFTGVVVRTETCHKGPFSVILIMRLAPPPPREGRGGPASKFYVVFR